MGFFSYECKRCGRSILIVHGVEGGALNEWMREAVAVEENGTILKGTYDGYGRVNDHDLSDEPAVWHLACWELAGKPTEYPGPSGGASDQGWFYDEGDYDIRDPRLEEKPACGGAYTLEVEVSFTEGELSSAEEAKELEFLEREIRTHLSDVLRMRVSKLGVGSWKKTT